MEIRPYQRSDKEQVTRLWRDVFGYTTPHNDPALAIRKKLEVQSDLFLVASDKSRVFGTVMGGYDGHRGWIYSLAVSADVRRRGIGEALVRQLEQMLSNRGCPKINLQVLAANSDAVGFYRKLGYAVEERISMGKIMQPAPEICSTPAS